MSMTQEVFLETTWEDAEAARQARDDRAAQLTAQGLVCTCVNYPKLAQPRLNAFPLAPRSASFQDS